VNNSATSRRLEKTLPKKDSMKKLSLAFLFVTSLIAACGSDGNVNSDSTPGDDAGLTPPGDTGNGNGNGNGKGDSGKPTTQNDGGAPVTGQDGGVDTSDSGTGGQDSGSGGDQDSGTGGGDQDGGVIVTGDSGTGGGDQDSGSTGDSGTGGGGDQDSGSGGGTRTVVPAVVAIRTAVLVVAPRMVELVARILALVVATRTAAVALAAMTNPAHLTPAPTLKATTRTIQVLSRA
jgi:hypothetical protein